MKELMSLIADTRKFLYEERDAKDQLFLVAEYESLKRVIPPPKPPLQYSPPTPSFSKRDTKIVAATPLLPKEHPPLTKSTNPPPTLTSPKPPAPAPSILEIRELFEKTTPHIPLNFSIPSDALAKERASAWKKPPITSAVVVLGYGEKGADLLFLQNLTRAVDTLLTAALLVDALELEKEKRVDAVLSSPSVRWIFTTNHALSQSQNFKTYYREIPNTKERFLAQIPLCIIPPPSFYLKNSAAKRSLWEMLHKKIKCL